jgi:hypothetical protein
VLKERDMFWKIVLGAVATYAVNRLLNKIEICNKNNQNEKNDRYFDMDGVPRNFDPNQVYGNYHNTKF